MADPSTRWQTIVGELEQEVRQWRRAHPDATLTELEGVLDARLHDARAELLAELAADVPDATTPCPVCGGPLVRRGSRQRTLRTQGDQPLPLTRPYLTCLACGAGLFPPR